MSTRPMRAKTRSNWSIRASPPSRQRRPCASRLSHSQLCILRVSGRTGHLLDRRRRRAGRSRRNRRGTVARAPLGQHIGRQRDDVRLGSDLDRRRRIVRRGRRNVSGGRSGLLGLRRLSVGTLGQRGLLDSRRIDRLGRRWRLRQRLVDRFRFRRGLALELQIGQRGQALRLRLPRRKRRLSRRLRRGLRLRGRLGRRGLRLALKRRARRRPFRCRRCRTDRLERALRTANGARRHLARSGKTDAWPD